MKNLINVLVAFILMFISVDCPAQQSLLMGKWRLTEIRKGNECKSVDSGFIFEKGGLLKLGFFNMEEIIEAGKWTYKPSDNSILMSSSIDKNCNGKAHIIKLTKTEMIYKIEMIEYHFVRLEKE